MISVINYGVGNINSVCNMICKVKGGVRVIDNPAQIFEAKKLILPGIGAFDHGMESLQRGGWLQPLQEMVLEKKVPILGICLGMQLMCQSSEEGQLKGLGWIDATVNKFEFEKSLGLQVPHMGWNSVRAVNGNALIPHGAEDQRFYFVHSYFVRCQDQKDVHTIANYGHDFVSSFSRDNIYGVQFHPEKSHRFGMDLIRNFVGLPC